MPRLKERRSDWVEGDPDDGDYFIDLKDRAVSPTEEGIEKMEGWLGVENMYDADPRLARHFEQALRAHALYKRDRDYIVKDGEIIIVDEFTGRQMPGRRWSEGLHQAIEAKEGLRVQRESVTLATITFQNYFRLYDKLAGMTGTAMTEAEEFHKIYTLEVVAIPTHKEMIRDDAADLVFRDEKAKFNAVIDEIVEMTEAGRPVLVGTVSVEKSELLSTMLKRRGIAHETLNAKFHEKESGIVAQAGRSGMVTIATNMAGRGTDILLGGNPAGLASEALHKRGLNPAEVDKETYDAALAEAKAQTEAEHVAVVEAGGLHIVGTERHDSRRIDNQLRGRAGRQGDPGSSRFYLSLEDDLMKRFASERVTGLMERLGLEDDVAIESRLVSKTIESAQSRVEGFNFDIRKRVVEFDDVINKQRETIYAERDKVLNNEDLTETVRAFLDEELDVLVETELAGDDPHEWNLDGLSNQLHQMGLTGEGTSADELWDIGSREAIADHVRELADAALEAKVAEVGEDDWSMVERIVLLRTIDTLWVEHLTELDDMRRGIGLRGYAQQDPLNEFRREAFRLYEELRGLIRHGVASSIFRVTVTKQPPPGPDPDVSASLARGAAALAGGNGKAARAAVAGTASVAGAGLAAAPAVRNVRESVGDEPVPAAAGAASAAGVASPRATARDPATRRAVTGSGATTRAGAGRGQVQEVPRSLSRDLVTLLAVGFAGGTLLLIVATWRIVAQGERDDARPADAIVVMGAAQYDGRPSPMFQARLDHAIGLYRAGMAPYLVVTGGKQPGDRTTEAASAREYAAANGVPADAILVEDEARTTFQSVRNVAGLLRQRDLRSALFVSDRPHMFRVLRMARDAGVAAWGSPTATSPLEADPIARVDATAHELGALAMYFVTGESP